MELALMGIGGLMSLVGFVCSIFILIHAFQSSVGEGFLCLCVPCYILYYAFSKFEHPKKGLILGGWLGFSIVGNVLVQLGSMMAGGGGYGGGY
jgi:translocator protein